MVEDIYINDFFVSEIFRSPNMIENIRSAEICSLVTEEIFKNLKFNLCNVDFSAVAGKGSAFAIELKFARGNDVFIIRLLFILR